MKVVLHIEDLVAIFVTIVETDFNFLSFITQVIHSLVQGDQAKRMDYSFNKEGFSFFYVLTKMTY